MDMISAIGMVASIYDVANKKLGKSTSAKQTLEDAPDLGALYSTEGSMVKLLSEFTVEPLLVISEDAMQNGSVTDKLSTTMLDIFTGYYLQSFNVLNSIYNVEAKTIVNILSTDNGFNTLKRTAISSTVNTAKSSLMNMSKESGITNSFDELLALTNEGALDKLNLDSKANANILSPKSDNGILGNCLLTRNLEINLKLKTPLGGINDIKVPITIRARLVKVSTQNILAVSNPNRTYGNMTTWLDYKAGLSSFWDFVFQTKAVKKYKESRLKGNEFLEIINSRKLSAYSKLAAKNITGYELNYNLIIITENDRFKIEKETGLNILKEKEKDMFLKSVYGLTCAVMDETYEQVSLLTPDIRGISTVSYKEIKNMNNKSNNDMTDLVKAIMSNKSLF